MMRPTSLPSPGTTLRAAGPLLVALCALGIPAAPAGAQTCSRAGCGFLPASCGGSPAISVPSTFWGNLKPVGPSPLPFNRDATSFEESRTRYSDASWTLGLAIENNYLVTNGSHAMNVWDLRQDPANPTFLGKLSFTSFPVWTDSPEVKWPLQDMAIPAGDDTYAAVVGEGGIGIGLVDLSTKGSPQLDYQDSQKDGEEVYAAVIGGTRYAFMAASQGSPTGGVFAYNMTQARQYNRCLESLGGCNGVYVGKIGSSGSARYVHGVDNFLAVSSGSGGGVSIYNVANPAVAPLVVSGLKDPPSCTFDIRGVYGVAMWKDAGHYYLGLRTTSYSCQLQRVVNEARIYDVSCISSTCSGLGNPVWSRELADPGTPNYFVTFSRSGATPFLYFGSDDKCSGGAQREYLFDVSSPASPQDISPQTGYWGWYYRGGATGFNYVMPRRAMFNGAYVYRAALSILDVHQRTGGIAPLADFSWSPAQIFPGTAVTFTDLSSSGPTSWSWSFGADGTTTGGTSTSSQNPQVTFAGTGVKTITLTSANASGTSPVASHQVTVLDPSPQVASVSVSPASPLQCQPITLTANGVTGKPTLTYSWSIVDSGASAAPGGTSTANPFVWDTKLNNALPKTYTATVTVANGVGTTSKSATFSLGAISQISSVPTPTNDAFVAGTVQFHVSVVGATEWNWDFGDGNGFTGWTADPVNGPNPSHNYTTTGNKTVVVKVRNCISAEVSSPSLTVNIVQIAPLKASFAVGNPVGCQFAPCSYTVSQAVPFLDASTGAQLWDYDWAHGDSNPATCNFTDTGHPAAVASHLYASAGNFQPCLRVRRGVNESDVTVLASPFHVAGATPPSILIAGPTSGTAGQSLSFTAQAFGCTPNAAGWSWTLPGGTPPSATGSAISVTYANAGSVTLTATNSGCVGATGTLFVSIGGGGGGGGGGGTLAAVFSFSPTGPNPGQAVNFDASASTGSPALYSWTFGDGSNDTGKTASHTYLKAGNYVVTLTVTAPGSGANCFSGTCISSSTKGIVVGSGAPPPLDPSFTTSASCVNQFGFNVCKAQAGDAVTFSAVTTLATTYSWEFGDGTTGSGPSVTHAWSSAGSFLVKLTVAKDQANANQTATFQISPLPPPATKSVLLPWLAETRGVLVQSSDLYVHNPGGSPIDVTLQFRRRGTPETNPPQVTRTLAPGATLFSSDVLGDLFSRPDNTVGFVTVTVPGASSEPVITSYNTTVQKDGTQFGQTISGVSMTPVSASASSTRASQVQHLVALSDNSTEVSYFGLSNPNDQPATYRLSLFDNQGKALGATSDFVVSRLGLKQFQREEIESLFGISNVQDYRVQIETISGGQIYPYGAKLRTVSQDPSFVRPGTTKAKLYVLGALSTPGLNGTLWRSDAVLSNTTDKVIQTRVSFLGVGVTSQTLAPITVTLQPGETQRLANVVADKWGVTDAVGILTFETDASSTGFPIIQAESYDFSQAVRRFGQAMPALSDDDAAAAGQGNYLVGLRQDATHWTAYWLFNPSSDFGSYDLIYRGLDGTMVGKLSANLPPGKSKLFRPSEHPIPAAGVQGGFTVQVLVKSGKALAAGQVVNLSTNDPAYILGTTR